MSTIIHIIIYVILSFVSLYYFLLFTKLKFTLKGQIKIINEQKGLINNLCGQIKNHENLNQLNEEIINTLKTSNKKYVTHIETQHKNIDELLSIIKKNDY